jgi:hypothetical protein
VAKVEKVTLTGVVREVDPAKREVTLLGPLGNLSTLLVDRKVALEQVRVGDQVEVEYLAAVGAELREPTADEKANPFVIFDAEAKEAGDKTAAAGTVRMVRVVGRIVGIDTMAGTAIVEGPLGRQVTVRVRDPLVLGNITIGQTVVAIFAEEMVVSLINVGR